MHVRVSDFSLNGCGERGRKQGPQEGDRKNGVGGAWQSGPWCWKQGRHQKRTCPQKGFISEEEGRAGPCLDPDAACLRDKDTERVAQCQRGLRQSATQAGTSGFQEGAAAQHGTGGRFPHVCPRLHLGKLTGGASCSLPG